MDSKTIDLDGLRVTLNRPRVVAETSQGHCWYPDLLQFSTGQFMLVHSMNPDRNDNLHNAQAVYLSTDQCRTFDFAYDVNGFQNGGGEPRLSLSDGRIVGLSSYFKPAPGNRQKRLLAHRWCYDQGGDRYTVEPWAVVVEGLPRDVQTCEGSRTSWLRMSCFSDILVRDDGGWLACLHLVYDGDARASVVAIASLDEGRHWRYLATIACPEDAPHSLEGFGEPTIATLSGGQIMCIMRVGQHHKQPDQWLTRSTSSDGGHTWSPIETLPAWSVAPQCRRLQNDTVVLSTGRPGIFLWLATDADARDWQSVDVVDWHNRALDEAFHIKIPLDGVDAVSGRKGQTTSYTAMVESSPNRLLLVYDRIPFGWRPVPEDSDQRNQIYLLEAEIERTA